LIEKGEYEMTPSAKAAQPSAPRVEYRGQSICYYHPTLKNSGSAMRLEMRVNRPGEEWYNCFFLELASQKTALARDGEKRAAATFDWENKITVKLDFLDICEFLTVLEGKAAQVGGARGGLYHATRAGNTLISFKHDADKASFAVGLSRKLDGAEAQRLHIQLSQVEATGLRCILQYGLFMLNFGAEMFGAMPGSTG